MTIQISPFSYEKFTRTRSTPPGYVCGDCGASGIRLYRDYQTFLDHQSLTCVLCTAKKSSSSSQYDPRRPDQFGWRVAAVPTEEGDTFWGYTSVPQPGVVWWYSLRTFRNGQVLPKWFSVKAGSRIPRHEKKRLKKLVALHELQTCGIGEAPRLKDVRLEYSHHSPTEITYRVKTEFDDPSQGTTWRYIENIEKEVREGKLKGSPRTERELLLVVHDSWFDTTREQKSMLFSTGHLGIPGEGPFKLNKRQMRGLVYGGVIQLEPDLYIQKSIWSE